jgi:hypothetical protein
MWEDEGGFKNGSENSHRYPRGTGMYALPIAVFAFAKMHYLSRGKTLSSNKAAFLGILFLLGSRFLLLISITPFASLKKLQPLV